MIYVVNDVETGGRHKWWHDVVSCGLVIIDQDFNIIDTFYEKCCPWYPKNFDDETVAIHGMSLDHLKRQQSSRELCIKVLHFLNQYRNKERIEYLPFVFHALNNFDYNFMENMFLKNDLQFSWYKLFNRCNAHSTIMMAREQGYEKNGLAEWAPRIGVRNEQHHNALNDAIICAKIFKHLKTTRPPENVFTQPAIKETPKKEKVLLI